MFCSLAVGLAPSLLPNFLTEIRNFRENAKRLIVIREISLSDLPRIPVLSGVSLSPLADSQIQSLYSSVKSTVCLFVCQLRTFC